MASRSRIESAKWFLFRNFELVLVVLLVASLLVIHGLIDQKLAFLSFYYLPIIVAGFFLGRATAVLAAVLVVVLVVFFQAVQGLGVPAGLYPEVLLTLVPWAGFLIITGYVVGLLAEQRQARLNDLKAAYVAMLEVLTFYLEATARQQAGHSHRVAELCGQLGKALALTDDEQENLRIAALFHEVGYRDPRLLRLLSRAPGHVAEVSVAAAMKGASDLLAQYSHYYEVVGDAWPVDQLEFSAGVKILAVADAFETLRMATPTRPAFAPWTAVEEIERGGGRVFAAEVVEALKQVSLAPDASAGTEWHLDRRRERRSVPLDQRAVG